MAGTEVPEIPPRLGGAAEVRLMSMAFSTTLHNILVSMEKGQWPRGRAFYPAEIEGQTSGWLPVRRRRIGSGMCPDLLPRGRVRLAVEDNLAILLAIFGDKKKFHSIHCQAFAVVDGTLDDVYQGVARTVRYLRLDYDNEEIGDLFSHPYPHIHTQPGDAPRLPLIPCNLSCTLIDFLEGLYLNFAHRTWMGWAKDVLKGRSVLLQEVADRLRDVALEKKAAFLQSQTKALAPLLTELQRTKLDMPFTLPLDLGGLDDINYSCFHLT